MGENHRHEIDYVLKRERKIKRILIVVLILILIGFVMVNDFRGIRTLILRKLSSLNFSASKEDLILLKGETMVYPCVFFNISTKVSTCEYRCGLENMEYGDYKCKDYAIDCYCKK